MIKIVMAELVSGKVVQNWSIHRAGIMIKRVMAELVTGKFVQN